MECLHTSRTLQEVAEVATAEVRDVVGEYKKYIDYACLQRYLGPGKDAAIEQAACEETWPAHASNRRLAGLPAYLGRALEGARNV